MAEEGTVRTMLAVAVREPGAADVLHLESVVIPEPGPGELLVKVAASGVNRPDLLQRQGLYPPPPAASPRLGLEVSGVVDAVGEGVHRFKVGDGVCALLNGGGYAQYAVVPQGQCMPVPAGVSLVDAAGLPEVWMTVWSNLVERGCLVSGERLLVHGGTSGIGCAAIALARLLGAQVIVTVGSELKRQAALQMGADAAILYTDDDWPEQVRLWTHGRGVDVILDMVAGAYLEKNIRCLADDGRLCVIALQGGRTAVLDCAQVLMRRLTVTGSTLRPRSLVYKSALCQALVDNVWPALEAGRIKPVVCARFPLERVVDAHRMMESGQNIGKIILTHSHMD